MVADADGTWTDEEVVASFERVKNWGRWGPQDERGTLNCIDKAARLRGAAAVRDGIAIGCSMAVDTTSSDRNRYPAQLVMLIGGERAPEKGYFYSTDQITIAAHGPATTHLDALCHVFFDGKMYNGFPASAVNTAGAAHNHVGVAADDGIVSRGVLLDMPRIRDTGWIEPTEPVRAVELQAALDATGTDLLPGDVLIVRLGRHVRFRELGPLSERVEGRTHLAGLHPDCIEWLHRKDIGLLCSDAAHDAIPSSYPTARVPIHVACLVFMGVHLLHNMDADALAEECANRGRWDFQFVLAPLRIEGGTASPVNPIAVL
jgi:kynurenine formamidase